MYLLNSLQKQEIPSLRDVNTAKTERLLPENSYKDLTKSRDLMKPKTALKGKRSNNHPETRGINSMYHVPQVKILYNTNLNRDKKNNPQAKLF